jgi:6-phospho-3-hexuloisomerase
MVNGRQEQSQAKLFNKELHMLALDAMAKQALADLAGVMNKLAPNAADALTEAIVGAKRIALHGLGREGLQMRGLAMRLFHTGLDVHVVGDMTVPPLGSGDLLIVSVGPGYLETASALISVAHKAGARVAAVTAQPNGQTVRQADVVLVIPAQTMADDQGGTVSILPMGSLFEAAQMLVFEMIVLKLRDRLGETAESMRARHTNLE